MNIAITQNETTINGRVYDCLEPNWYSFLATGHVTVIPNTGKFDLHKTDLIVFSGGRHIENRRPTEVYCFDYAVANDIPMLGICHGAFFLNYMLGGTNGKIDDHWGTEHEIEMDDKTYVVNSYHRLSLQTLDPCCQAIARHDKTVEAFKHKDKPIWGLVWHPERMTAPVLPHDVIELLYGNII